MNEFNVLLAAATNGTTSGSLFDALFARYIAPQESWRELESPLPITILAAGEDLIDYRIYGNTENGESVGERTENLFDVKVEQGGWDAGNGMKPSKYGMEKPDFYYTRCRCDSIYATDPKKQYTISIFPKTFQVSVKQTGLTGVQIADTGWGNDWTVTGASGVCFSIKNPTNSEIIPSDIQGVTIIEGSTAPTSYIPFGYKLPMVVRSRNLFDSNATDTAKGYIETGYLTSDGVVNTAAGSSQFLISEYIDINGYEHIIVCSPGGTGAPSIALCFYDSTNDYIYGVAYNRRRDIPVDVPRGAMYVRFTVQKSMKDLTMLTEGSTAPTSYIPYYRDEENIYIGSNPLAEDEYVDFGEQKIYRMVNGTLTPTDPPVPIPALPTIQGETIIDYNPSTTPAVEPEKMYVKYKPQ